MCNCDKVNESNSDEIFEGIVIFFSKSYGFATKTVNGVRQKDIFCHYSDIIANGFRLLKQGQKISYKIGKNNFGADKAIDIRVISES